ncbi:MAG: pyruvate dehydrogenase complex dihydrolipoamide acetyltransferase [Rhodospirillaceae bacterium]|nr:pyruvate dehydrogenase complex dihydrolipoamide acetyltransferase [Rhodospirillaceae bacterium]
MPTPLLMPALSPSMTEGTLARWLKKEGDSVTAGEALAEIESDKATIEFESPETGTLGRILVPDGSEGILVASPIGLLLLPGEDAQSLDVTSATAAPAPSSADPATKTAGSAAASAQAAPTETRVFASPLARRVARTQGIDLAGVTGSGPRGRILKRDVMTAAKPAVASATPIPPAQVQAPAAAAPVPSSSALYEDVPLSAMRKVIARRLTDSKQTVPHFYLTVDCQLDQLLRLRAEFNGRGDGVRLSVNDFVVRAVALALRKVPAANASFTETAIRYYKDVDISVAVATPGGLITPILRHADHKGLATISAEMRDLAARARDGKLKPDEFQGGTFSISNLGMYGIRQFEAIINPPQGCIMAVGAAEPRIVVQDDAPAVATVMTCSLSVDHRVVDGAVGAEFLAAFKKLIEDPVSMLL